MIPIERQKKLLRLISQHNIISIADLVEKLGVSHMTVRRDIQKLEHEGLVASVSGGVRVLEHLSSEPTHQDKSQLSVSQKENIGLFASQMIPKIPRSTLTPVRRPLKSPTDLPPEKIY